MILPNMISINDWEKVQVISCLRITFFLSKLANFHVGIDRMIEYGASSLRSIVDYLPRKTARWLIRHSSEIRGLRSMKCSSETLQNLLYFMYKKTHVGSFLFVFHFVQLYIFTLTITWVYVDIDQGIYKVKI